MKFIIICFLIFYSSPVLLSQFSLTLEQNCSEMLQLRGLASKIFLLACRRRAPLSQPPDMCDLNLGNTALVTIENKSYSELAKIKILLPQRPKFQWGVVGTWTLRGQSPSTSHINIQVWFDILCHWSQKSIWSPIICLFLILDVQWTNAMPPDRDACMYQKLWRTITDDAA